MEIEFCSLASLPGFGFAITKHFGRFLELFDRLRLPEGFLVFPAANLELAILGFGMVFRRLLAHLAGTGQHPAFVEAEEFIELLFPVLHEHLSAPFGLILGKIQPHGYDAVQFLDLVLL